MTEIILKDKVIPYGLIALATISVQIDSLGTQETRDTEAHN